MSDIPWDDQLDELRAAEARARAQWAAAPMPDASAPVPARSPSVPVAADFEAVLARAAEVAAAREAHRATCTCRPCPTCGLARCPCGADYDAVPLEDGTVPVTCPRCRLLRGRERLLAGVRETICERFRDVTFDAPDLARRVGVLHGGGSTADAIAAAVGAVDSARVTLVGEAGAGKTTLAAAMLNAVLARAAPVDAPAAAVRRAAGALWTTAYRLHRARLQHPLGRDEAPLIERAMAATVLVVDNLGAEEAHREGGVAEVLFERFDRGAATWVTTHLTPTQAGARYDGGIARRLFEGATKIVLRKRAPGAP